MTANACMGVWGRGAMEMFSVDVMMAAQHREYTKDH